MHGGDEWACIPTTHVFYHPCPVAGDVRDHNAMIRQTGGCWERSCAVAESFIGTVRAPEFPIGLTWFNTDEPLTLAGLRGKLVIIDFWTYC